MKLNPFSGVAVICCDGFFGIGWPVLRSMNLSLMEEYLREEFDEVFFLDIESLQDHEIRRDWLYITSSSQNKDIKKYYDDILDVKFGCVSNLEPRVQLIKAHDNKGYQGLLAAAHCLPFVKQSYHYKCRDITSPLVIKSLSGAGSKAVKKVRGGREVKSYLVNQVLANTGIYSIVKYVKYWVKHPFLHPADRWDNYIPRELYVLQEYKKGLSCDYKVLVFWNKVFVLKRSVRKGDFRASGSGLFSFDFSVSGEILDFAFSFREKIDAPYISLDVIEDEVEGFRCIEYQCVHFGPFAQQRAPYYFEKRAGRWCKKPNDTVLEKLIVESVVQKTVNQ